MNRGNTLNIKKIIPPAAVTAAIIAAVIIFLAPGGKRSDEKVNEGISVGVYSKTSGSIYIPAAASAGFPSSRFSGASGEAEALSGYIPVKSLTINAADLTISQGQSVQLFVTVSPAQALDKKVVWSSSNANTAQVSGSGTVYAENQAGTAVIYAVSENGVTASCRVTVNPAAEAPPQNPKGPASAASGKSDSGNLAGLSTYGDYPYPYAVEETNAQFQKNEPEYNCEKIAADITAQYASEGCKFDTCSGDVFREGDGLGIIRGRLSGKGGTEVVDVIFQLSANSYTVWNTEIVG